ncbi:ATP-binding protein [Chelatococcus asaccharovorans]|uniref:ATP-binding protein n=1 Tax=Chelatococcus asaccharovorans TaxID=28210 RepID=UPI002263C0A5|nr:winged helix-turn-helix domain-containing protein [Chelatococcus asaccharovorans]
MLNGDKPVALGSRAFDILLALTDRPGELVTKGELIARAWPQAIVEESNLRAQVAQLRRSLGDNQTNARFVAAVPGRGYRFVAPVAYSGVASEGPAAHNNLPRQLKQPIGRAEAINAVRGRFQRYRMTTIVGPGGIGKTTLCIAVAEQLLPSYEHGVCFLDLAPLANAQLMPGVLANALRLADSATDPLPGVFAHLREKRMLLVLDSCEFVVDATARLAEMLMKEAPGVHILATSREALRVEEESVYRLAPLDTPPETAGLTAEEALTFPAVQLFVDRVTSSVNGYEFNDNEAALVADICRQLDGIALAIELAAGRVEAFGTRGVSALLDDRFRLLTGGRRTSLPRHQTLEATIDWSYDALSSAEQLILRKLAIFAGEFMLDAVLAITSDDGDLQTNIPGHLANLVAKSLIAVNFDRQVAQYRLLDTTRAYALAKLAQRGERDDVVRRVGDFLCGVLKHSSSEIETVSGDEWLSRYGHHINKVRMVLDWANSPGGDAQVGLAVTVAAIPLWYQLSLVDECLGAVQRALLSIDPGAGRDMQARQVMQLYTALGLSQAFKFGFAPQAPAAFTKALEIAEGLNDVEAQLEALWGLWFCQIGMGEYRTSLELAQRFMALAESGLDRFIGDRMISMTLFCMGDHRGARRHANLMLTHHIAPVETRSVNAVRFRFGHSVTARVQPAQLLWMQGFPEQAIRAVESAVGAAEASGHAISLCEALARWSCPLWIHMGDLVAADLSITTLLDLAAANALSPWEAMGRCWKATLLIKQGSSDRGIPLLRTALDELQKGRLFTLYNVRFLGFLAEGLAAAGQIAEGLAVVEAAIRHSEDREEFWCIAELLRVRGEILSLEEGGSALAELSFRQSIDWAQRQDALSWELLASMSLARRLRARGEIEEARGRLARVYSRFTEGLATPDLKAASALLAELS